MHILFYAQAVCARGAKWTKVYLTNIAMWLLWFPSRIRDNVSILQDAEAIKHQEGVSEMVMWYFMMALMDM